MNAAQIESLSQQHLDREPLNMLVDVVDIANREIKHAHWGYEGLERQRASCGSAPKWEPPARHLATLVAGTLQMARWYVPIEDVLPNSARFADSPSPSVKTLTEQIDRLTRQVFEAEGRRRQVESWTPPVQELTALVHNAVQLAEIMGFPMDKILDVWQDPDSYYEEDDPWADPE